MSKDYPIIVNIGDMKPGESKTLKFAFSATWNYNGTDNLPLKVKLTESRGRYGGVFNLGLTMNIQQLSAVDMKKQGTYQQDVVIQDVSLTSDVDKNIPINPAKQNRFDLIIGNEHYISNGGLAVDVPYAINDALTFKEYAVKTLGVPDQHVKFFTDLSAIKMKNEIESFINIMKSNPDAEFFVYYAGHGYYDNQEDPFIMPVDLKHTNIDDAVNLKMFYSNLSKYTTKRVTIFLDACFSGGGRGDDGLVVGRTGLLRPTNNSELAGNLFVFAASTGVETSKPYDDQKHGVFTYFLLKELQQTKGNVTYKNMIDHLNKQVSTYVQLQYSESQVPSVKYSQLLENNWENLNFY